ncbi:hypothetical protein JHK87_043314 [Glycine soja]|nr:hypothetical protein JHK87_043314 [Glycine soja]
MVVESESYSSDGVHELELLLSFVNDSSIEACSQGDAVGILLFSGLTDSFAYLNSKEPISQAVTDIKGDIITSLQSRLYIICDEVDVDSGNKYYVQNQVSNEISAEKPVPQLVLHLLGKGCSLPFPRRVFAPWLAGMYLCDYLQPSETFECPPIQKFSSWKTRANMMAEARLQHTYKQALQYYKMIPKQNMTSNQISLSSNRSSSPNSCNGSMNNENEVKFKIASCHSFLNENKAALVQNCIDCVMDLCNWLLALSFVHLYLVELGSTAKDIISLIAQGNQLFVDPTIANDLSLAQKDKGR